MIYSPHSRQRSFPFVIGIGVLAMIFGFAVFGLGGYIVTAGHYIASDHLEWDYLNAIAWGLLLFFVVGMFPANAQERKALLLLWLVKLVITLGLMLPYEQIYCADACGYHRLGLLIHDWWPERTASGRPGFGNGTANMEVFAAWHAMLISRSFHAMKVTWSLFGFFGIYLTYRAASLYTGKRDIRVLYLLSLFPGILFWSSIFGKDPLTLLGISAYVLGVVGWYRQHRARWLFLGFMGLLLAAFIRIWLGAIFLLPVVLLLLRTASWQKRIVLGGLAIVAFGYAFSMSLNTFKIDSAADVVTTTNGISQAWAQGGSAQKIAGGLHSFISILAFLPVGAFSALFLPLPGQVTSVFGLLASVENVYLLWLVGMIFRRSGWAKLSKDPLLLWAAILLVTWSSIYGVASYQNLGTAVRFKLQVEPVLLLLLIRLAQRNPEQVPPGDWRRRSKPAINSGPSDP